MSNTAKFKSINKSWVSRSYCMCPLPLSVFSEYILVEYKKGGLRCGHSPKQGVLGRCGHNQINGGLRGGYNPKMGNLDLVL